MSLERSRGLAGDQEDLGVSKLPLCREPWESLYILRRGILPCPYGNPIGPMADYVEVWNSPPLQEIRGCLARGDLSPYCRENLSCPIVLRVLQKEKEAGEAAGFMKVSARRPLLIRVLNKAFFGLPKRIYRALKSR